VKVYYNLKDFEQIQNGVVTSGTFDGVHLGHQKILARLKEAAASINGETLVITFWPHPRLVVAEDSGELKLLSTINEKIEAFEKIAIDHLLILPFTREFSELSSEKYIEEILIKAIGTKVLVIGYDHRFGKNREGGFDYLTTNANRFKLEIVEIPRQEIDHLTISSTKIRKSLSEGKLEIANELLGRNYEFSGIVAKGRQLGRTIGFPTANVNVSEAYKLIPANGVYAVRIFLRNEKYEGIMNIGNRPTVDGLGRTQEVNIFNFSDDIYGERLKVELVQYIRSEKKFESLEDLKTQINLDCELAKKILK
jgi:riboflavin kinase / FMN adenylyltransferase